MPRTYTRIGTVRIEPPPPSRPRIKPIVPMRKSPSQRCKRRPFRASELVENSTGGESMHKNDSSGQLSLRGAAILAVAMGAVAVGALAVGTLAIGSVAIGRLWVSRTKLKRLEIEELSVARLSAGEITVKDSIALPQTEGTEVERGKLGHQC